MGWATKYIESLKNGETVQFRPSGHSMKPKINHRDLVTVEPIGDVKLEVGFIVLCKVKGRQHLHLIKKINVDKYLIGNNRGYDNGWVNRNQIYGIVTKIED